MFAIARRISMAACCLGVVVGLLGCNAAGGSGARARWSNDPSSGSGAAARLARDTGGIDIGITNVEEVDLVESLVSHRDQYHRLLRQLHDYYKSRGYIAKERWAAFELQGLRDVQTFRYLMDAEVPSDLLRPVDCIAEADALFEEALDLMRRGGHNVPGIYRRDRMIEAARKFRQLITQYPSSDKIDDAAFFCGEIHKEYLPGQELIAVKWYERAFEWNPETPHPARFQAAVVYDYRLHDRDRALELYHAALKSEAGDASNVRFATRRIRELTGGVQPPPASAEKTSG